MRFIENSRVICHLLVVIRKIFNLVVPGGKLLLLVLPLEKLRHLSQGLFSRETAEVLFYGSALVGDAARGSLNRLHSVLVKTATRRINNWSRTDAFLPILEVAAKMMLGWQGSCRPHRLLGRRCKELIDRVHVCQLRVLAIKVSKSRHC